MPRRWTILLLAALAVMGCGRHKVRVDATQESDQHTVSRSQSNRLTVSGAQADRLDAKMRMMTARMSELQQRNRSLVQELGRLRFLNDQLRKQLVVVGDSPNQSKLYKSQLAKQRLLIEQLNQRIAEMEQKLKAGSARLTNQPGQSGP
jgi:regulator of replication initiation timing